MEDYARNYSYYYMNGNETTTILGCTSLFREMIRVFDIKALLNWINSTDGYLGNRKYTFKQVKPDMLNLILRGLGVSYADWHHHLKPRHASSILFKLYAYGRDPLHQID